MLGSVAGEGGRWSVDALDKCQRLLARTDSVSNQLDLRLVWKGL